MQSTKLIIALDYAQKKDALLLIDQLNPEDCILKVGSEMFTLFGPDFINALIQRNFRVFLDLKFHDIPNTVARACAAAAELGVWMINVHASGGAVMMNSAREAIEPYGPNRPLLMAVTLLTSFKQDELASIGITSTLDQHVARLALLAQQSGLDGIVCSAFEVPQIKKDCGKNFLTVTPGIRLEESFIQADDQSRSVSVKEALQFGSDFLVVGRPITLSVNPVKTVNKILKAFF